MDEVVNDLKSRIEVLGSLLESDPLNDALWFERGKLRWRLGDRSGATGDFARASELNPAGPATRALENAVDVADFFNPDLYNP